MLPAVAYGVTSWPLARGHYCHIYETMKVALPPEQMKWLEAEVSAWHFNSIDDAMAAAVAVLDVGSPERSGVGKALCGTGPDLSGTWRRHFGPGIL